MRSYLPLLPLMLSAFLSAAESKDRLVRETEPLTAEQERAALHVPPGFEVQLFASEPMINKPINMAFDARGRLWVSSTVEYPYSADKSRWSDAEGTRVKGSRDAIKILEDTDGDGKADKVIDFADGLNIPTGVVPWHKPEHKAGCIAWSIPNIWYFADTDGDDKADIRQILFGPLGYEKDTHGMCSSFRLGLDGWVYATHGFNNTSKFKAKDGSSLELHSGNVFRFKPDGSTVERWTHGQVNPFGLCWDRYGNLYSADCHSSPIYQLIRGAHYPSFGKPHDGLGFAPVMCEHTHGSTGICGIVYLDGGVWGAEWDDHMLVGNPVTSKVNRDLVTFSGSTPKANERPDFITSDDPWFRPVDLQLGPDNALYIADFYNRIIGHYEVSLEHPGRDKERGRIWRVVKEGSTSSLEMWSHVTREAKGIVKLMEKGTPAQRRLAIEAFAQDPKLRAEKNFSMCGVGEPPPDERHAEPHAWLSLRPSPGQPNSHLESDVVNVLSQRVIHLRLLALRIAAALGPWRPETKDAMVFTAFECPTDQTLTIHALADAVTAHPSSEFVSPLIDHLHRCPASDVSLKHSLLVALRNCLEAGGMRELSDGLIPQPLKRTMFEVITSTRNPEAAKYLFDRLPRMNRDDQVGRAISHIARYGDSALIVPLIQLVKSQKTNSTESIQAISDGLSERGAPVPQELHSWAQELAEAMLVDLTKKPQPSWTSVASSKAPIWALKSRKCSDGKEAQVLQSMSGGGGDEESRVGILKSKEFVAPNQLSLWVNGHRGFPKGEVHDKNLVRVVDATSGEVLASVFPPKNDVCQRMKMDLAKHAGKQVRLEIVDGDDGKAYAWLGITRIEPAVVSVDDFQTEDTVREGLKKIAVILQHSAPAALREKLAAYLPPRPAPPPLPISPEQRKQIDTLITSRVEAFAKAKPDVAKGKQVFQTNCAVCHRIGGEGGLIGPQLDGIGTRGVARLSEDILDPNRNVDAHFHVHTFTLKDGAVFSGFLKAEAGQVNILVDAAGKEHRVTKKDVEKSDVMPMSLMPPVFGQTIDEASFQDLLGYLLGK
ncbi:PVC-type heme-binding CxxCH protein [Brevifollis gellanilyticus]|nr:PVC-type heme-binding CxxCH protein [Brevifollis gellanilyticus]